MKKYCVILILLFSGPIFGQHNPAEYLIPSFYSTAGKYNNNNSSACYTGQIIFTVNQINNVILRYNNLAINNTSGDYERQLILIGEQLEFFPWYINANIIYAEGNTTGARTDIFSIYNLSIKREINTFKVGAAYTYISLRNGTDLSSHQAGVTLDYHLNKYFSFHIINIYTRTSGRDDVIAGDFIFDFSPVNYWRISISKSTGKKIYYFCPVNLTLMPHTQTSAGSFQIATSLKLVDELTLSFHHSQINYNGFHIKYFGGGIRFHLKI